MAGAFVENFPMPATAADVRASDPIALAVEEQLRKMQTDGYGELRVEDQASGVSIGFGGVSAQGENYDIALVRLANALLSDARLGNPFLERLRGSVCLASH